MPSSCGRERGQVIDELFEPLAGHDELDVLREELERRGDLTWEPGTAKIGRRVRSADELGAVEWRTWGEVCASISRMLEERRAEEPTTLASLGRPEG